MDAGLYPEMKRDEYDAELALNYSTIKVAHEKSMLHAYNGLLNPTPSTAAQIIGLAWHHLTLQPGQFLNHFAPMPVNSKGTKLSRTSADGAIAWDRFDEEHAGKHAIKPLELKKLMVMREAVMRHPIARKMIENASHQETSFFWEHPQYEFECKGQFDLLTEYSGWSYCADLKSTKDASPRGFEKEIASYSYMIQHHWYLEGLNEIAEADRRFAFIACEKTPPYLVCIHELCPLNLFEGKFRCEEVAAKWDKALDDGKFIGYPGGINMARAKRWAMDHERAFEEEGEQGD